MSLSQRSRVARPSRYAAGLALFAAAATFAATGCGGDEEEPASPKKSPAQSDRAKIRQTIDRFVAASISGDTREMCRITDKTVVVEGEERSCKDFSGDKGSKIKLTVRKIQINPPKDAVVRTTSGDGQKFTVHLEKDARGRWLFGGIASASPG